MTLNKSQYALRIAGVINRKDGLQNDLWKGAAMYLHKLPRCIPFVFHEDVPIEQLAQWRPDGMIAHCSYRNLYNKLARLDVPMVNTSGQLDDLPIPTVTLDNIACGTMAARYLLANGYRHFAYLGFLDRQFSLKRLEGFRVAVEESGHDVAVYAGEIPGPPGGDPDEIPGARAFAAWLSDLPDGTGIMVADDPLGLILTQYLRFLEIQPRRRLGIISGHDRQTPSNPTLTAVRQPEERWGYEAARLLLDMMRRPAGRADDIVLPPLGIIERESTTGPATDDPYVVHAMRFISDHAADVISVGDVAKAVSLGRRALERRFANAMRCTILHQIHRAHVELAKQLLFDTDMSMQAVAVESGLSDEKHLRRLFRQLEGTTPNTYRRRHRITG
ncbi:MAG: substrate-binding domain-containing protein [Phycisphaeraceae bacterium]|nr:substrate-binding domain-containing protein [Phycisphaeraceae bacterium]